MFIKSAKSLNKISKRRQFEKIFKNLEEVANDGYTHNRLLPSVELTPKQIKVLKRKGYTVTKNSRGYDISWEDA